MKLRAAIEDRPPRARAGYRPGVWRFAALAALAASALGLAISFLSWDGRCTLAGTTLGGDWPAFYVAGQMLSEGESGRLYDLKRQSQRYHQLMPGEPPELALPFVNPPFVAAALAPLSRVPYEWSYLLWTLASLVLYGGGVALALATCGNLSRSARATLWLVAMAFEPFLVETVHGGQLSAAAVAALGLAVWLERRGWPTLSGAALGVLFYKPTLLPLVLLMLIAQRRWRVLAGVAGAGAALALVSLAAVGREGCEAYLGRMAMYATAAGDTGMFPTFKFVDVNSFMKLAMGRALPMGIVTAGLCVIALWLASRWHRADAPAAWAQAILLTPVVGIYCGIYDAAIAAVGAVLAIDSAEASGARRVRGAMAVLFVAGWVTQPLAMHTGVQALTIALLGAGVVAGGIGNGSKGAKDEGAMGGPGMRSPPSA